MNVSAGNFFNDGIWPSEVELIWKALANTWEAEPRGRIEWVQVFASDLLNEPDERWVLSLIRG
jgi:hypothetical protein